MSRKTWSADTDTTVPWSCFAPGSDLCVWLRSNCDSNSAKLSVGSAVISSLGFGVFSGAGRDSGTVSLLMMSTVPLSHASAGHARRADTLWEFCELWRNAMRRDRCGTAFVVNHV